MSDKCYVHELAKKKARKILTNYHKVFFSANVKRFIDEIELKNEKKEFHTSISRRVTSASTLRALEVRIKHYNSLTDNPIRSIVRTE